MQYRMRLILFSLVSFFKLNDLIILTNKNLEPFYCDRNDSMDLKKGVFGFLNIDNHLFLIFEKKIILFPEPFILIETFEPVIISHSSSIINNINSTTLYEGIKGIFKEQIKKINFSIRLNTKDAANSICCELVLDQLIVLREQACELCSFKQLHVQLCTNSSDYCYYLRTKSNSSKSFEDFLFKYENQKMMFYQFTDSTTDLESNVKPFILEQNYKIKHAIFNFDFLNLSNPIAFEIDEKSNLHLSKIRIQTDVDHKKVELFDFSITQRISLDDFFGCIQKLTNLDQIYGIIFKKDHFYLVLRQYYVKFKQDLVSNRFENIDEADLYENRNRFDQIEHLENVQFQLSKIKWTKRIRNKYYLRFCSDDIFEIRFNKTNLNLKRSTNDIRSIDCEWQTIEIKNNMYCFKSKYYYKMQLNQSKRIEKVLPHFEIERIFAGFNFEENLQFIFNYKENSFVIMTDNNLFNVNFDKIKIKPNGELFYTHNFLDVQENCILKACKNKKRKPFIRYSTDLTDPNDPNATTIKANTDANSIKLLMSLLIFLIVLTVIIVYSFFFHKRKKDFLDYASKDSLGTRSDSLQRIESLKKLKSDEKPKKSKELIKSLKIKSLKIKSIKITSIKQPTTKDAKSSKIT